MQAGDLRSKVGFYKRPTVSGSPDYGVTEGEYPDTPEFQCAANIKPKFGNEQVLAARLTGTNVVNITVRQSSRTAQVDTTWMVKNERSGETFNIRNKIDPNEGGVERGSFWELLCEKGVAP